VGGGLSGGLLARRLIERRPDLNVCVYEGGKTLGGNHTWSFHTHDLTSEQLEWIRPLLSSSWQGYEVCFPKYRRELQGGYHSIRCADFHERLMKLLGVSRVRLETRVDRLETLDADLVLDARGFAEELPACGWQKFVGWEVELEEPHGLTRPLLKDATVAQLDGYRFIYTLPWGTSDRELLIEDTRYSNTAAIQVAEYEAEIRAYAHSKGWKIRRVLRSEVAALPIPIGVSDRIPHEGSGRVVSIGVRSALFNETTGYSLPYAVRTAFAIAALAELTPKAVHSTMRALRSERRKTSLFYLALNRMLFLAADPEKRYRVLERFYRLPEPLIERFYAGQTTALDAVRILVGRPPVPVGRALSSLFTRSEQSARSVLSKSPSIGDAPECPPSPQA
jgi:lycopene beta-cyclase